MKDRDLSVYRERETLGMSPICELVCPKYTAVAVVCSNRRFSGAKSLTLRVHFSVLSTHQVLTVRTLVSRYLPRQLHVRSLRVSSGPGLGLALCWQPALHYEGAQRAEQLRQVQAVLVNTRGSRDWAWASSCAISS